jgi:serine/threonine protein kinase
MSYRGLVGLPTLEYSTLAVSRRNSLGRLSRGRTHLQPGVIPAIIEESESTDDYELPPFIRILNLFFIHTQGNGAGSNNFITNIGALHDVAFTPKCPILGIGHHFAVYASEIDSSEDDFKPVDGRAFNNEVYCLKAPNFTTQESRTSGPAKDAFRKEYYETVLQELRVLLHPDLRSHDNIISVFGLDFQEDYDDCTIAWPLLLMENAEYGTLDTLQQDIHLDPELSRILLLDVTCGIQALHRCNIIHGDVKSENVLICRHRARPYVARLSDFGLSLVNPDISAKHRLPGGTFLWRAPECDHELSVELLRQTDVYSFGLTAWRVLVNNPNPYSLIPLAALGLQPDAPLSEVVSRAKAHQIFTQLVLQTMEMAGVPQTYALRIVECTLGKDPASRDLNRVLSILASGQGKVTAG